LEPVLAGTAADDSHDVVLDCPTAPFWAPDRVAGLLENGDNSISGASVPGDVFGLTDSRSLNSVRLAAGFEPKRSVEFLAKLDAIKDVDRLFAPPVLGVTFRDFLDLRETVEEDFDIELVEASPSRDSVQGERLRRYIGTSGTVEDFRRTDREVDAIVLQDGSELHASTFVLSTGRWLGGLERGYPFKERLFGLPAWFGEEPVDSRDNLRKRPNELLNKDVAASHPVNRIGIRTDEQLRPLDRRSDVAFDNLHAVGDILGGTDPVRDGTRLGVQIVTALRASSHASQGVEQDLSERAAEQTP
jgi:anaerobic glycerol-3-phosphate dehydrogenase